MKLLGRFIVFVAILMALSFVVSPGVAFLAVRSAAETNDTAGLARLVDFGAVRQSLRPQLAGNPAAMAPAPSFMEDPIGAVRHRLEQVSPAAAPDVDAYLTPAALAALTRGEGRYASQRTGASLLSPDATTTGGPLPRPVYWGIDRARMSVSDDGGSQTIFTFERKGLFQWKLVHIRLPEGVAPVPPYRVAPPEPPRVGAADGKSG